MEVKSLKIAVCDDNKLERENIVHHIECYYYGRIVPVKIEQLCSRKELLGKALHSSFDIVFVCLNGADGIETSRELRKLCKDTGLIIINNTADYGIEAHGLWAVHYLIKPVHYDNICKALARCEKLWQ